MASYTDSPQVFLPKGAPLVDLQNYEATLQYKDNQYNQGVQRIQNSYDQVAGLDVIRPMDKDYLQSKLGDLTTQLNQLAGGDFSNQSLVQQASALAPKIARDSRVQNAVLSTQAVRNVVNSGKQLKKAHPELYPIQAEDHDNTRIAAYTNSSDPDATFNGSREATQYNSYHKPLMDFLSEKDPTIQQVNLPNGQFTYKTVETSKITDAELQNLINGFFMGNPQYQQSAKLDGEYSYKGYNAPALYSKAVGTMKEQLDQYTQKYIDDEKRMKPHQHDVAYMQQYNKEASSTKTIIDSIKSNIGKYNSLFSKGVPIEDIKTELQMDQIRNTYTGLYAQDNKKEEIKANEDAINSMRFRLEAEKVGISASERDLNYIQAGINPKTGQRLKPGDEYYEVFLAANPGYAKLTSTKAQDPSQRVTITPGENAGNVDVYSDQGIEKKIAEIELQMSSREGDVRKAFAQSHTGMAFDHDKGIFLKPEDEKSFKDWEAQQELYIQKPELQFEINPVTYKKELVHPISQDYLDYRQEKQMMMLHKQNFYDIKSRIGTDADSKFSIQNVKDDIQVPVKGGFFKINIGEISKSSNLVNLAYAIDKAADANTAKQENGTTTGGTMAGAGNPFSSYSAGLSPMAALTQEIDKYKGTKEYTYLKTILESGSWGNFMSKLNESVGSNEKEKNKWKNTQYKAMASRINPQGTIIDKDDYDEYRGYISSALQNNPSGAQGIKDVKDVVPHTVYTGLDKKAHIQYVAKDGTIGDIAVPSATNIIGKPNADQDFIDAIENSYSKSTPMSGTNVLVTPNGKIKYAVAKNPLDNTSFKLFMIDGQTVIPILNSANQGKYMAPGEAQRQIVALSTMINSATKQPYTAEELVELTKKANK